MSASDPGPSPHLPVSDAAVSSVFVYGTLMPGEHNARVAEAAGRPERAERATLSGYTLYDLQPEGYPALIPDSGAVKGGLVRGWVLHYTAAVWPRALLHLDELEGLHLQPPLYTRTLAQARTAPGERAVWVYLYARAERLAQAGCRTVESGDWTDIRNRSAAE